VPPAGRGPLADDTPLPAAYAAAAPALNRPALAGTRRCDVAIVGGGFSGLSAALHLAQAGCAATVLEAREIGWGGSGRAFGQVVPYAKHDERHILASFGPDWGERLITGLAGGPDLVFRLIAEHGIECEPVRTGLIFAAHARSAEPALERRAVFWQQRGADVAMLHDAALATMTGTEFYKAALLDRRGGSLNPLAYARGLARAALAAGAAVYENTRALALLPTAQGWTLRTPAGELAARRVVLATDAYTDDLWPGLRRSLLPLRGYQLVSETLPEDIRRRILPGGQALTDTRHLYSGVRMRRDGRLHVSVDGPPFSNRGAADAGLATARVRALFPDIAPPRWEHSVAGWVGMTADQYPHVHRLAPGLIAALGLSGRGIAFATLLGREISLRVLDRPQQDWMLPDTKLRPIPAGPLARLLLPALIGWYRARDTVELRRGR